MRMIEQQVLGVLQGRIRATMATQNIDHPVLNEIDLTILARNGWCFRGRPLLMVR